MRADSEQNRTVTTDGLDARLDFLALAVRIPDGLVLLEVAVRPQVTVVLLLVRGVRRSVARPHSRRVRLLANIQVQRIADRRHARLHVLPCTNQRASSLSQLHICNGNVPTGRCGAARAAKRRRHERGAHVTRTIAGGVPDLVPDREDTTRLAARSSASGHVGGLGEGGGHVVYDEEAVAARDQRSGDRYLDLDHYSS